ncbi:MAG TPA: hypothetical protein VJZ71_15585 [Phycisphaerae bacterium]|nr:hypothetical protein [Phycisphaerae bacterium]
MRSWLRELDLLLRGQKTAVRELAEGRIELPLRMFFPIAILMGAIYGVFMGFFAVFNATPGGYKQLLASTLKLPAMFLLTLIVTFPSLYVFNALLGSRLSFLSTLRLLVGAIVVNLAVAASLGPILGFFTLSTTSYSFMILLNILLLSIGGIVGLGFLLRTLRRLSILHASQQIQAPAADDTDSTKAESTTILSPEQQFSPPEHTLGQARSIFRVWIIIYALVGAQMGWLLRPFIGSPNLPFAWFRAREGNFFESAFLHLRALFSQ